MNNLRTTLMQAVFVSGLCCALPVLAQDTAPSLWERLKGAMAQETEQLQQMLGRQQHMESEQTTLEKQLEQNRRMRAMHREAVLLTELNIAWIYDELDHWDCQIAAQKVYEVDKRIAELSDSIQRLDSLCGGLGTTAGHQQQVCVRQRSELSKSVAELENLRQRYDSACSVISQ